MKPVIAAMQQSVTQALLKSLYGIMVSITEETTPAPALRKSLQSWLATATPAIKRFSLPLVTSIGSMVIKGTIDEITGEMMVELGQQIKGALAAIDKETDIDTDSVTQLRTFGSWFRVQSDRSYDNLAKQVSVLNEPSLTQAFIKETRSQAPTKKALMLLVKKVTKRSDSDVLETEELKKLKEKNIALYKEYNRLRRDFNGAWKEALQSFVRTSGKRLVSYDAIIKYLKSQNMKYTLPNGFKGLVDDSGKMYTSLGKLINGVPNAYLFPLVVMNPDYDPKLDNSYVFVAEKATGEKSGYFYTTEYKKTVTKEKFTNVEGLKAKIKSIRNQWFPHLKNGVSDVQGVMATILEILLQYSARIGSKGNSTEGSPTFGISTLQVKHLKIAANGDVTISYKGKDGVAQQHYIKAGDAASGKYITANLRALCKGKKPADPVFTLNHNGHSTLVTANLVNRWFKSLGAGSALTVHKMRTLRGTVLFQKRMEEELAKLKGKTVTDKQGRDLFMKIALEIGAILGHIRTTAGGTKTKVTGTTALQSYIDPGIQLQFFSSLGLRPPKYLEKFE